jgi:alpha-galactosidase
MIQVGGHDAFGIDYHVPLKYGVDQCIGDTLGPGRDLPRAAHIPSSPTSRATWKKSPTRTRSCSSTPTRWPPTAWRWAASARSRSSVLCHGVQTTLDLIAGYIGIKDKNEITYTCGGVNHMDWFLRLEHNGRDLYPELREKFEKPEYYKNEKVRGEVFRHFGYFIDRIDRPSQRIRPLVPQERQGDAALL